MSIKKPTRFPNIILVLGSVVFTLFVIEVVGRIVFNDWRLIDFLAEEQTLFSSQYPVKFDNQLGWIPRPGVSGSENVWGTKVTILEDGIRSNGVESQKFDPNKPLILAVGDSFTFGDQVSDEETWPAILQKMTGNRVLNGGVFGYGMDQTFLRMEGLVKKYKPKILVFGLIVDDIKRCEMAMRTAVYKPYFDVNGGQLQRFNDPVPRPFDSENSGVFKKIVGRSLVAHKLMMKLAPGEWLKGKNWNKTYFVHSNGEQVACALLKKLPQFKVKHNLDKIIILVQYAKITRKFQLQTLRNVLKCVDKDKVDVVDSYLPLLEIAKKDRAQFDSLFDNHMTYKGNTFIAELLMNNI